MYKMNIKHLLNILFLGLAIFSLGISQASAEMSIGPTYDDVKVLLVPQGYSTIQSAIDDAEDGDYVVVATGLYRECINFKGKMVTVKNARGAAPVIDGSGFDSHIVTFNSGEDSHTALDGFIIQGMSADKYAIYCSGSSPIIRNNQIIDAYNNDSGGIYSGNTSNPYITNNTIKDNNADNFKAIACENNSSPTIIQNNIIDNSWRRGAYFRGVYCSNDSSPQIINNVINNRGTGVYCLDSSPVILSNFILAADGEGIYCQENNSSPQIIRNIITGAFGSGIHCLRSAPKEIRNNVLVGNNDGVILENGPQSLANTLIINNIIFANGRYGIYVEPYNILPQADYNDIYDNPLAYSPPFLGPGAHDISADPFFLSYNTHNPSDPNNDYRLQTNSPCVDAGDPNPIYNDPEDPDNPGMALPPARRTVRNDMGAYGGPETTVALVITSPKEAEAFSSTNSISINWVTYGIAETENLKLTIRHLQSSSVIIDKNEIIPNTGQYVLSADALTCGTEYTLELSKQTNRKVRDTVHFSTLSVAQRSNYSDSRSNTRSPRNSLQQTNR